MVEKDEPEWCINVKKSLASQLQLDVSGVRSVSVETLLPVFGERSPNSRLAAYEVSLVWIYRLCSVQKVFLWGRPPESSPVDHD